MLLLLRLRRLRRRGVRLALPLGRGAAVAAAAAAAAAAVAAAVPSPPCSSLAQTPPWQLQLQHPRLRLLAPPQRPCPPPLSSPALASLSRAARH
jgi:hypothetical protein